MNHRVPILLACLVGLIFHGASLAQVTRLDRLPQLVVSLQPAVSGDRAAFIQQQLILHIQVISPTSFSELHVEMPTLRNASMLELITPKTAPFATWGAEGHRHERVLAVFPEHGPFVSLPPIRVHGRIDAEGRETVPFDLSSETTTVSLSPADPSVDPWLIGSSIEMSETWSKDPMTARVGDIVQRKVRVLARGIPAERLPELQQRRTPGLGILARPANRRNEPTRQGIIGHLEQTFEVRIEGSYPVHISPISLDYVHVGLGTVERAFVPAYRIEPLPPDLSAKRDMLVAEAEQARARSTIGKWLIIMMGCSFLLVLAGLLAWTLRPDQADRKLKHALTGSRDALTSRRALQAWRSSQSRGKIEDVRQLDRHIFGASEPAPTNEQLILRCLKFSRGLRRAALRAWVQRLLTALLGPQRGLTDTNWRGT